MRTALNTRASLRSALIHATVRLRVDELALRLQRFLLRSQPRMLVIEMHETPTRLERQFRQQLEWVAQHFTLVDLAGFVKFWETPSHLAPASKPPVLFTFDDGRLSNYLVAAPVLESFGARGVFFVIPQWVESREEEARQFYYSRIDPHASPEHTQEDWNSMNPAQLRDLAARGHTVGSHTYSHVKLLGLTLPELHHEIADSAAKVSFWTGKPVDAIAWTFAWDAIDRQAWDVIRKHHRFCFAPCPVMVDCQSDSPDLIWRREIEVRYSEPEFRFMYSGLVDWSWRRQRQRLRKLLLSRTRVEADS